MKKLILSSILATVGICGIVYAQQPAVIVSDKTGWHRIGETTVDFQKESDEILVMGADRFASIKFKVEDAPIDLISMEVFYESGDTQVVNINMPIKKKGESRTIDLKGGERDLKKIVFVYKTLANRKDTKASVEVWGLKTNTGKK